MLQNVHLNDQEPIDPAQQQQRLSNENGNDTTRLENRPKRPRLNLPTSPEERSASPSLVVVECVSAFLPLDVFEWSVVFFSPDK